MATLNFNANNVAPQQPLEAIPSGWYKAFMSESKLEPTSNGDGLRLNCEYTIADGPYKGRKIFDGFNMQNKNPQAVEIAQQQLSALCHAVGVLMVQDSAQLHNIPFLLKVSLEGKRTVDALGNEINPNTKQPYTEDTPNTKTYEAQNRIKGFKNINDGEPTAQATANVPAGAMPSWATNKPATPAPANQAPATTAPATTSNALPPWEQNKASATNAAPAAQPAQAPAPAKGPKSPKKPVAAKAEPERKFYVYYADDNMPLKTESEVKAMFAKGMPADTPLLLEKDVESGDWKDATQYGLVQAAPAQVPVTASVGAAPENRPPWER